MTLIQEIFYKLGSYNDKFKVRVIKHGYSSKYYCIDYKCIGYFQDWNRYCIAWLGYGMLDESVESFNVSHPYLYENFDEAVSVAKELTPEYIKEHNSKELEKYNNRVKEGLKWRAERNKSWEN